MVRAAVRSALLAAAAVCALVAGHAAGEEACDADGPKLDCGYLGIDADACVAKGCCWGELAAGSAEPWCFTGNAGRSEYEVVEQGGHHLHLAVDHHHHRGRPSTTTAAATTVLNATAPVFTATLVQTVATLPALGEDAHTLTALADASCSDVFRLTLRPADGAAAYAVPASLFAGGLDPAPCPVGPPRYAATVKHAPFSVHVGATGEPGDCGAALLETTGHRLIIKPRYTELTTNLHPDSVVYGLGERTGGLVVDRGAGGGGSGGGGGGGSGGAGGGPSPSLTAPHPPPPPPRTIWARDQPASSVDVNLYGAWPAWLEVLPSGSARGGLLLSGTAVDVVARPGSLSFRVTGPGVDLFIFAGPTPAAVMDQLTRVVGRPAMPPAWALGVHQSRWGYKTVADLEAVVDGYARARLPLDVLWSDIDHMEGRRDFTLSPTRYPADRLRALVSRLHAGGRRWVPILDPGIKVEQGYAPYDDALAAGVFVRAPGGGQTPFVGTVWPGAVHYPDFVGGGERVRRWWASAIKAFHDLIPFDGLWIDMNEPSNFNDGGAACGGCDAAGRAAAAVAEGEVAAPTHAAAAAATSRRRLHAALLPSLPPTRPTLPLHTYPALGGGPVTKSLFASTDARDSSYARPTLPGGPQAAFYPPNNGGARLALSSHSLPPDAVGADGALHLDTHNLYGHAEAAATHAALRALSPPARPFILTRSSFLGTGAWAAHWSGDNGATWADLAHSISSVLASGLAGMPMAGADVCGFSGNTTPALCARWVQVAALQPFFRDHSDLNSAPQELYRWPSVAATARVALTWRYALLPALYSALAAATDTGAPAARPLWFEFPASAGARADRPQWMVGPSIMVAPAIQEGATTVSAWLPPATAWVDVREVVGNNAPPQRLVAPPGDTGGTTITLAAPEAGPPPALLLCGRAIALAVPAKTAEATLTDRPVLHIIACLEGGAPAAGEVFADDGLTDGASTSAAWFDLEAGPTSVSMLQRGGDSGAASLTPGLKHWPRVGKVTVVGAAAAPSASSVVVRACGQVKAAAAWAVNGDVLTVEVGEEPANVVCDGGVAVEWGVAASAV